MGWDYEDAEAAYYNLTPEELEALEADLEQYEQDLATEEVIKMAEEKTTSKELIDLKFSKAHEQKEYSSKATPKPDIDYGQARKAAEKRKSEASKEDS